MGMLGSLLLGLIIGGRKEYRIQEAECGRGGWGWVGSAARLGRVFEVSGWGPLLGVVLPKNKTASDYSGSTSMRLRNEAVSNAMPANGEILRDGVPQARGAPHVDSGSASPLVLLAGVVSTFAENQNRRSST